MDDFLKDVAAAQKCRDLLLSGLDERTTKNQLGETDALLDARLRGWLKDLAVNFDSIVKIKCCVVL